MAHPRKYPRGYYAYIFYDASDVPIWVGAGKGPRARLGRCRKLGGTRVEIIEAESKEVAFQKEAELIKLYGRKDLGLARCLIELMA